jgi:hypothetical protein
MAIQPGNSTFLASVPYSLITLLLGWWGIPWGLVLTPGILWRNTMGGTAVHGPGQYDARDFD